MARRSSKDSETAYILDGKDKKFGIVVSDWNKEVTDKLLNGCTEVLLSHRVAEEDIRTIRVPGSFELPMGAKNILNREKFDAIICLGCIIKGETRHDEYISQAVANGCMQLGLLSNTPIIFGVLTPKTYDQALERAGGTHGNKGIEAATTALRMAELRKQVGSPPHKIGFS
jgi:6,7-dimethyl-8-ribityllumazine synthase